MNEPRISIIICTMNRLEDIQRCLDSVCKLRYPNYEVIVVDSSSENVAKIIHELTIRINAKYIFEGRKGLSFARNKGIKESIGEIVVFTDDDAIVEDSWLEEISAAFTNRELGFVCGKIYNIINYDHAGSSVYQKTFENAFLGVNLAFRREVLERIGGFDETFLYAGEDQDIIIRTLNAGIKGKYLPRAKVWHVKPPSNTINNALKMELRNGKADLFLIVKDAKILSSNLKRIPFPMVINVINTLCILCILPLIIISLLSSIFTILWSLPLALIIIYLSLRFSLSEARTTALFLIMITPGLSFIYWFYLFQSLWQVWHLSHSKGDVKQR